MGDDMYGKESEHINRHALHAKTLDFNLTSGLGEYERTAPIHLEAPMPNDMQKLKNLFFTKG